MFLEGQDRLRDHYSRVAYAAVAGRWMEPRDVWPDIFPRDDGTGNAVPSEGADMSQFTWEHPAEDRAQAELEQLLRGAKVTMPAGPDPAEGMAPPPVLPPAPPSPPVSLRPDAPVAPLQDPNETQWL
jgi:hypothetical protein